MRTAEVLRSEAIAAALDQAIVGRVEPLYKELANVSGLPGTRVNMAVAQAFANECAARGKKADALVFAMASLSPEEARGATGREFLPVCGVLAVGARAAKDKSLRSKALTLLHSLADDPRFRVRDAVPLALARMGSAMGDALPDTLETWMDGYFHAAAVVRALAEPTFLDACDSYYAPINLLHDAWTLARDAPRAAKRYPGRKALVEALAEAPIHVAFRFLLPMIDRLTIWADDSTDPEMGELLERIIGDKRMKARFHKETLGRVTDVMKLVKKPPRDPTRIVKGTRGRGKKRG